MMIPNRMRRFGVIDFGACLVPAALFIVTAQLLSPYAFDDAYIHLRIVESWLVTGQPNFNPGEAVKATSSTGWMLVLAALLSPLTEELRRSHAIDIIRGIGLLASLGSAWVVAILVARPSLTGISYRLLPAAAASVVLLLLLPSAVGLMETPVAALALLLAAVAGPRRPVMLGAMLGVAYVLRIEYLVAMVAGWALCALESSRRGWVAAMSSLAIVLPALAIDLALFGTTVPQSIAAKSSVYTLSPFQTLERLLHHVADLLPVFGMAPGGGVGRHWTGWTLAALILLGPVVVLATIGRQFVGAMTSIESRTSVMLASIALVVLSAYVYRAILPFPWYLPLVTVPALGAWIWALGCGRSSRHRIAMVGAILAMGVLSLSGLALHAFRGYADPVGIGWVREAARTRQFIEVGRHLDALLPSAKIATSEVGGLGWGFRGIILDGLGLITPRALEHHPVPIPSGRDDGTVGALPRSFVLTESPDVIVGIETFVRQLSSPELVEGYCVADVPIFVDDDMNGRVHLGLWNSWHLRIFVKTELCAAVVPELLRRLKG